MFVSHSETAPTLLQVKEKALVEFQSRHRQGAISLAHNAVQRSSLVRYEGDWKKWCSFIEYWFSMTEDWCGDLYLEDFSMRSKVELLCAFMHYAKFDLQLKASTVCGVISGIGHHFRATFQDMKVFENASLRACKTALRIEERVSDVELDQRKKLPVTTSMVQFMVSSIDTSRIEGFMLAVALQLAFCCMLRVSEYVYSVPAEKNDCGHTILASHVEFVVLAGGEKVMVNACEVNTISWSQVLLVRITLHSAKNDAEARGHNLWFKPLAAGEKGIDIAKLCFDWASRSNTLPHMPFFSYRPPRSTGTQCVALKYNDVSKAVKTCAFRFGFNPAKFGTHSLRIGGACTLRAGGASDSSIMFLGRWKSLTCCLSYQSMSTEEFCQLQSVFALTDVFTTDDIRLLHQKSPKIWSADLERMLSGLDLNAQSSVGKGV